MFANREKPRGLNTLIRLVDKNVRLKLLSVKGRGNFFEDGLVTWFGAKPNA